MPDGDGGGGGAWEKGGGGCKCGAIVLWLPLNGIGGPDGVIKVPETVAWASLGTNGEKTGHAGRCCPTLCTPYMLAEF